MTMTQPKPVYDRTAEDLGNIVEIGHVNVQVADQSVATTFYVEGLGLTRDPYLQSTAAGIARFYREVMAAPAELVQRGGAPTAHVPCGYYQWLDFTEVPAGEAPYDGNHIQIYIANITGPHARLEERNLVTRESSRYQFNFEDIVDLESGKLLFKLEHEVRSMTHPMYGRALVNRDPTRNNATFVREREALAWETE